MSIIKIFLTFSCLGRRKKFSYFHSCMGRRNNPLPMAYGMKKRRFRFPVGKYVNAAKSVKTVKTIKPLHSGTCLLSCHLFYDRKLTCITMGVCGLRPPFAPVRERFPVIPSFPEGILPIVLPFLFLLPSIDGKRPENGLSPNKADQPCQFNPGKDTDAVDSHIPWGGRTARHKGLMPFVQAG